MPKDCQEKKLDDTSPKESQSKKLSGTAPKKCQSKKLNSTAPKDCQCKKFTISALAKKQRKKNSSVNVSSKKVVKTLGEKKPQDHRKTRKRKSNKTPSTDMCAHASTVATSDWKPEESKASLSNEDREVGNKDKLVSAQDEFMSMSYIDQENSLSPVVCTEEPQTESSVAGGSSRSSMKSNPQIDHLRKCRSMLTKVTLSELSERLEQAHEYLRGIINGTIFSEKHKIFKEQGKACGSLLSIEVYAVFQEEQSEFMIDLMRKKYFEKLHLAIEDRSMNLLGLETMAIDLNPLNCFLQ
ncbi:uncharacterized protein [Macrobrachium rosenbergii]|uniref:uncharacterized protein isoform X2 n=1 Tax=Macrobrachium rosenbergii TaxID=79674 RepID=UPI0034D468D8